jgi:hypothetical protein
MSWVAASVRWSRSRLAPFVIDLIREVSCNKKSYQSNGWGKTWDPKFTVALPSNEGEARGALG